jgi:hypothetical protein
VILYVVDLIIDAEVAASYRSWLTTHVREMLSLPGFLAAELFERRTPPAPPGRIALCVQYRLASDADLERYLREDAPRMRAEGLARFAGSFQAERRVLSALSLD